MKKIILSGLLLAGGCELYAAVAEDSHIFTPYFDMTLTEAAYLPSRGNIFSGGNINTQVGLLAKATKKDSFFGLYNFSYSGPAFQPQDGKQFTDRDMSHGFNLEYRRSLNERFRLRPGVSYSRSFARTGANEAWQSGLYNMNSRGAQLSADYGFDFDRNGFITATWLMRKIEFPNYTDLLREFQNPSNTAETSGGLQDQFLTQISLRPSWNGFFAGYTYTEQKYKNQRVVDANTGVYGEKKQKDSSVSVDGGFRHKLWVFEFSPMLSYTMRRSNQNFLRYKSALATNFANMADGSNDVTMVKKNYDYNEMTFAVPVDLNITGKWALGGNMSVTRRVYTDRGARDIDNNYVSAKQKNLMSTLTGSIRKRMNDVATMRLFYSLVVASSNNKFEKYMPYNYNGNAFGISYQLSY